MTLIGRHDGFTSAADAARHLVDTAIAALAPFAAADGSEDTIALLNDLARYILARNK